MGNNSFFFILKSIGFDDESEIEIEKQIVKQVNALVNI